MNILSLRTSLFIMGMSGIIAQIMLLRELLVSFYGNELTIGVILANWLILEAIGSFFVGRSVEKTTRKLEIFVLLQLIFSAALPLALYLARIFKNIIIAVPGEGLGFAPVFYTSFLILLPVGLSHGALFTYGCKLYSQFHQEDAASIGKVYILETIGSIAGGLLITFLLIQYFNAFEIAFAVSLTNTLISVLLLWPQRSPPVMHARNVLWGLSLFLSLFFFSVLLTSHAKDIHLSAIESQWRGLKVIHNENSSYGNITITQSGEQYTFYTDGIPSITTPVPDIASVEDVVHFSMLSHERPESILILGGGAGGMISEILKYHVTDVSYVELDPLLLKLIRQFPTPVTQAELSDKRVSIHYTDSRFFVARTKERFDLIFLGLSSPQELQTNRLFTAEFFSAARKKITPAGIVVLTLPGSLTYLGPELKDLNGCILDTLKSVFRYVKIIPGTANIYLASDSDQLDKATAEKMIERFGERGIQTSLFTKSYIEYRLQERWLTWFLQGIEGRSLNINSDFQPLGVFFSLAHWNALFSPYITGVFKRLEKASFKIYMILTVILTILLATIFIIKPRISVYSIPYAIFVSGFADMILELAIIFTFQTLYGYLYFQIGLLITIFMAGAAVGSLYITRRLDRIKNALRLFMMTELFVVAFAFFLPFVFLIPSYYLDKPTVYIFLFATFMAMSFVCGALVGFQFPLANKIYLDAAPKGGSVGETAGLLYGADLFGGFFGGLLGGVLFLPVLGLMKSCFLMAIIKMSSFFLFVLFTRIRK